MKLLSLNGLRSLLGALGEQAKDLLQRDWLKAGVHTHTMGGDCPGKTELGPALLRASKIVVEFRQQSLPSYVWMNKWVKG